MQNLSIVAINIYQKYISPYKGFRCAHAALHHGDSCSAAVKKIIEKHGLFGGYRLIRARFKSCRESYLQLAEKSDQDKNNDRKKKDKWYDCCDPSAACDVASCIPKKGCDAPDLPCDCSLF